MAAFDPKDVESLMPMPISSVRLAEMVSDPESTIKGFSRVIELDQALTLNVLKWANSSFSSPGSKIETVRDAVVRLGTANILKLAVGQHLLASFSSNLTKTELGENELWRHSVAAALAIENIGHFSNVKIPGVAFTAALVHDVGKLILCRRIGYDAFYEIIHGIVIEKGVADIEAERIFFRTDHAEVGGAVARHWGFSEDIITSIELHHSYEIENGILLDLVVISDIAAHGIDMNYKGNLEKCKKRIDRLNVSIEQFNALVDIVRDGINKSELLWQ